MPSLFRFYGRTGRLGYTIGMLLFGVLAPAAFIVGSVVAMPLATNGWRFLLIAIVVVAASVAMVWLPLALAARRSRDIGWNPTFVIATYAALWLLTPTLARVHGSALWVSLAANLVLFVVLAVWPGQPPQAAVESKPLSRP